MEAKKNRLHQLKTTMPGILGLPLHVLGVGPQSNALTRGLSTLAMLKSLPHCCGRCRQRVTTSAHNLHVSGCYGCLHLLRRYYFDIQWRKNKVGSMLL